MSMFPLLSFEQANPVMSGVGAAQKLQENAWQNQLAQLLNQNQRVANQYQPQNLQQALRGKTGENDLQDVALQFAPANAQAGLDQTRAQTGLTGAQTNLTNTNNKFAPMQNVIEALKSQQQSSRFGQAYQLSQQLKTMPVEMRSAWIAQNTPAYNEMMSTLANQSLQQQSSQGSGILNQMMNNLFPKENLTLNQGDQNKLLTSGLAQQMPPNGMPMQQPGGQQMQQQQTQPPQLSMGNDQSLMDELKNNPEIFQRMMQQGGQQTPDVGSPQQAPQQPQQMPGGQQTLPVNPMMRQMFSAPTQAQNDQMQRVAELSTNKHLTTAATQRQQEGAVQVENIMSDPGFQFRAENAAKYAGALGKGEAAIDALGQNNPKAYEDYLSFRNQDMVLLQNRIKTLDGMGSTDAQREELHGLYAKTMDSMTSNPEQFMTQLKNLQNSLKNVARSVQKSANPVFDVSRQRPDAGGNAAKGGMGHDPLGLR